MGTTRIMLAAAALSAGALAATAVTADAVDDPGIVDPGGRPQVAGAISLSTADGVPAVRDLAYGAGAIWAVGARINGANIDALVARIASTGESDDAFGGSGADLADAVAAGDWGAVVSARVGGPDGDAPAVVVRRYDADGAMTWQEVVEGAGVATTSDVAVDGGRVYVAAGSTVATFALGDGAPGRSVEVVGTASSVATLDGDVFVAGASSKAVPGGGGKHGGSDIVLRRLDGASLGTMWTRQLGGPFNDHDPALATAPGVVYLTNTYSHNSLDRADIWSLTPTGQTNWHNRATGEQDTATHGVTATPDGPVVVGVADLERGYLYAWNQDGRRRWPQNDSLGQYGSGVYGVVALPRGLLVGGDGPAGGYVAALVSHRPEAVIRAGGAVFDPWAVFGVRPGKQKSAKLRLRNAGDVTESFVLKARCQHPKGVKLQMRDGGRKGPDIRKRICGGHSMKVSLKPGQKRTIVVVAKAGRGARPGQAKATFTLKSPAYAPATSTATLTVKALKKPKKKPTKKH